MKCPDCKVELKPYEMRNGIEVDRCATCQGVWFDAGELAGATGEVGDVGEDVADLTWSAVDGERTCPTCAVAMDVGDLGDTKIEVDTCPKCHGIWLDKGEYKELVRSLAEPDDDRVVTARVQLPPVVRKARRRRKPVPPEPTAAPAPAAPPRARKRRSKGPPHWLGIGQGTNVLGGVALLVALFAVSTTDLLIYVATGVVVFGLGWTAFLAGEIARTKYCMGCRTRVRGWATEKSRKGNIVHVCPNCGQDVFLFTYCACVVYVIALVRVFVLYNG